MQHQYSKIDLDQAGLFKKLLEMGPAIAFIWDPSEGWPVIYVSENISTLGYRARDFLEGKITYDAIIHPHDLKRIVAEVKSNIALGATYFEQRYRILNAEGQVRLIRDWTFLNRNPDGEVEAIEGMIVDITAFSYADERARRLLDTTNDIYINMDAHGVVLEANDKACDLVGVKSKELIGSNWVTNHVPEEARPEVLDALKTIIGENSSGIHEFENDIISLAGKRFRIHWYYCLDLDAGGRVRGVMAFGANISSRMKVEQLADDLANTLMENPNPVLRVSRDGDVLFANTAAQELLTTISVQNDNDVASWRTLLDKTSQACEGTTQELTIGDSSYLFMISPEMNNNHCNLYGLDITHQKALTNQLNSIASNLPGALFEYTLYPNGNDSISYMSPGCMDLWELTAEEISQNPAPLWEMILPEDLKEMQSSVLRSSETGETWQQEWRIKPRSGMVKWLSGSGSPIRQSDGSTTWTTIVLDVTKTMNAELAVSDALAKTVHVLAAALETRDAYTAGHQKKVSMIAVKIGQEMQLDSHRLNGLELAATIHDIGKISIPAELLNKSGPLTDIEFSLIKTHPVNGAALLKDIDFNWPISTIVRQHHERFDGSGYPDGLKGEEIILEARIIAVADTLEAMTNHRPYRPGLGIDKAIMEIQQESGKRYDPDVAAACLKLIRENKLQEYIQSTQ